MNKPITFLFAMAATTIGALSMTLRVSHADELMAAPTQKMMHQERAEIAPHAVMIESQLMSALDQLKGIRAQLDLGSTQAMNHIKMHGNEINADLKMAIAHQAELRGAVKAFPDVAMSSDYKAENAALMDVANLKQTWQAKTAQADYWKNIKQAKADLDLFESRLNLALTRTKNFSTNKLNVANVG